MHRLLRLVTMAIVLATLAPWAAATSNLNLSKSNINRIVYPADLATKAQVKELHAAVDKLGPAEDGALQQWLRANFKRFGIHPARVKKIVIVPASREMPERGILLLTSPDDEQAARSTVKSSKSNSSD
jgi:hypothetical protein